MVSITSGMIVNTFLVMGVLAISVCLYAAKDIARKLKYTILKNRGYGVVKYVNRGGIIENHFLKLGDSIKVDDDRELLLPPNIASVTENGMPCIYYNYRDSAPMNLFKKTPDEISPEYLSILFKEKEIITKVGMLKEEERKDQLDQILKLVSAGASAGACFLIWKLMTDLQPVIRAVG